MLSKNTSSALASVLEPRISFSWNTFPQDKWCNFSKDELKSLAIQIADFIGITPEQANLIEIRLEDHLVFRVQNQRLFVQAYCGYDTNEHGDYSLCTIAINRSDELSRYANEIWDISTKEQKGRFVKLGVLKNAQTQRELSCYFQHTWENIVWLLAEELSHAYIYLKAKNEVTFAKWQHLHVRELIKRKLIATDFYDCDFSEVEASRICLDVLKKFAQTLAPDRIPYYEELLADSNKLSLHVTPNIAHIVKDAYIKTGFNPRLYPSR
jgi:hypothetical protein